MRLFLPEATTFAWQIDMLIAGLLLISLAVLVLVFSLMFRYIIRYRAGNHVDRGAPEQKSWRFEIGWTAATLLIFFALFLWGAKLYLVLFIPPAGSLKIYVVAKQWMWKVEHAGGQREIDALHVPVDRPIELVMTSEDVIHDFSVPAFRIKHDVLPGRYEALWFRADRIGAYKLYCTQFCGADHARMTGEVVVMSAPDFQHWLAGNVGGRSLVSMGQGLFRHYGCDGCHDGSGTVPAPALAGLYGTDVRLANGSVTVADDGYLRDAIVAPSDHAVAGYRAVMPSFGNQISEADLIALLAYLKSLKAGGEHG